ncbi:MAG: hypothetical protein KKA62_03160 [Nanoarchaeota archaeon]|nr:hypothetical protein [Nanoarchaeota archaeon]MBU1643729.1 hypothetical protein [Nanoarchaeota archaeon]MBU1976925.1 hypothetical protein [Nanoarchaeota archaeon]
MNPKIYQTHSFGERLPEPLLVNESLAELLFDFDRLRIEPDTIFKVVSADLILNGCKEARVAAYQFYQTNYGWKTSVYNEKDKKVLDFMKALVPITNNWECFKAKGIKGFLFGAERELIISENHNKDYYSWHPGNVDLKTSHAIYHYTGSSQDLITELKRNSFDYLAHLKLEMVRRNKKRDKERFHL